MAGAGVDGQGEICGGCGITSSINRWTESHRTVSRNSVALYLRVTEGTEMRVTPYQLPDSFLIVPNLEHFFGEVRNQENCLDVIESFSFKDIAEIFLIRLGAIGFRFFRDGPMQSILRLQTSGSGLVPEHVTKNHDEVVELQGHRLVFANFIAGALFGRLSALRRSALSGAQYAGMDEIVAFAPAGTELAIENSKHSTAAIGPKIKLIREAPERIKILISNEIRVAVEFVAHIAERESKFEYADLQACMVMNYQAAILHNEQHAAASLALNFAVAEALIREIFLAYGIVGNRSPKQFAKRAHTVPDISNSQFSKLPLSKRVKALLEGELIDHHLFQRLDEARTLRNNLMHSAAAVSVTQSGTMQTAVRDLWYYVLDEPFELVTSWSMRI